MPVNRERPLFRNPHHADMLDTSAKDFRNSIFTEIAMSRSAHFSGSFI